MGRKYPYEIPALLYADNKGKIYDFPGLKMAGRSGRSFHPISASELIPLPEGSELFVLPGRLPVGWDDQRDEMVVLEEDPSGRCGPVQAVAAFMAPAYTQTALAAFYRPDDNLHPLPLFAYTPVGWWKGRFWVAAFRSDPDPRQDSRNFNPLQVKKRTLSRLKRDSRNRLLRHLGRCSLTYGCPAAKNLFLGRWEAPLPTSPECNARCLGCLSKQPPGGPPATQERIRFVPSPKEVAGVAVPHLEHAKKAIVSFGQGCEGEPLLQAGLLQESIRLIRKRSRKGTINLNTNASLPAAVAELRNSGLQSIRISMNSPRQEYYERYYRPRGYGFEDVLESWRTMKEMGGFVSLNWFVMPGLSDELEELEKLAETIASFGLDFIQLRNHNIDPDWYLDGIAYKPGKIRLGIKGAVNYLKGLFPSLGFGYFNPPLTD